MAALERNYNVPLRKEWLKVPKYKRTAKAMKALKQFLARHMKSEEIKVGPFLNEHMWKNGIKNPPHHVKVNAHKFEDGRVHVELEGKPMFEQKLKEEVKEKSKIEEKLEGLVGSKKGAPKTSAKKEAKKKAAEKQAAKGESKSAPEKEESKAESKPAEKKAEEKPAPKAEEQSVPKAEAKEAPKAEKPAQ